MSFSSLPFELVVRIFRLNAHRWQSLSCDTREPLQDTIAASQVCSRWRSIVLSAPELWRFAIDPYHRCASWRNLLLQRSQPLSIEFMDATQASQEVRPVHDIQLQMQSGMHLRLRRYDMRLDYKVETIPSYLSAWPSEPGSWPQLRRLCLEFIDRNTDLDNDLLHPPGNLPVHFPGLATPILEYLSLASCYMPDWDDLMTIGNTLTHLEIFHPPSRLCPDRCIEIIQNLPNLESLELSSALEMFCRHPHSNSRSIIGVKEFAFSELLPSCASFLDRIDLCPECIWCSVTCYSYDNFEFEISEEEGVKAVLPHMKRLLSRIVTDTSRLLIFHSLIMIDSGLLAPAILSRNSSRPVIAEYSNHFSVHFDRNGEGSTHDTHDRPFLFPDLLDFLQPISTFVELTELDSGDTFSGDDLDHFLEFLVQCRNLRFMRAVSRPWWERLCKRLMPAAGEVISDATEPLFPRLQMIEFDHRAQFEERFPSQWVDVIPFDELQAFCKHRARIRVPLERICFSDAIFMMDNSGEINLELEPWEPSG